MSFCFVFTDRPAVGYILINFESVGGGVGDSIVYTSLSRTVGWQSFLF